MANRWHVGHTAWSEYVLWTIENAPMPCWGATHATIQMPAGASSCLSCCRVEFVIVFISRLLLLFWHQGVIVFSDGQWNRQKNSKLFYFIWIFDIIKFNFCVELSYSKMFYYQFWKLFCVKETYHLYVKCVIFIIHTFYHTTICFKFRQLNECNFTFIILESDISVISIRIHKFLI